MDSNEDSFPQQMAEAAQAFTSFSAAYAQLRDGHSYIDLHIEAPEIMMKFAGQVQFGKDPKGTLFYDSYSNVSVAYFTVFYYEGPGFWKTVRIDFLAMRGSSRLQPFARFLARVDTEKYKLPPVRPGLGHGWWKRFKAATSQVDALRQEDSTRLYLQLPPILREVYFETNGRSSVKGAGILIFHDVKRLKDRPFEDWDDDRPLVADYSPDGIVFHLQSDDVETRLREICLFLPDDPLEDIGEPDPTRLPETTWRSFEDDSSRSVPVT